MLLYRALPRSVDILTAASTYRSRQKLKASNVKRLLIDNTILAHGVTHETVWVDTGKSIWGGQHEVDTGYSARIPVHRDDDESEAGRSVRYLPGLASLARRGHLCLAHSDELRDERMTQPAGRFSGYGCYDYSMFSGVRFETIHDPTYSAILTRDPLVPSVKEQRKRRLEAKRDVLYKNLVKVLGPKNSQDVWHIATAEHNDCYCFLTMDFRLIRNVRAQANNRIIKSLKTRVLSPEEFGREFSIYPISPRLFSYHGASFPVIHEENWPDSRRQKHR